MRSLRFCFLTTFYPPFNFGGDGIAVQRLARALARRGHDVTVVHEADAYAVLNGGPGPVAAPVDPTGVKVVTLRSRAPLVTTLLTQQTGHPIVNGRKLERLLTEGHFDVVNFNNISLLGGPALLGYGNGAVKVYHAHEHWLVCPTHVLWRHGRERCDHRECVTCQLHHKRPPQLWRHTGLMERYVEQIDIFVAMSEFSRTKHREFGFAPDMSVLPYFLPDPDPEPAAPLPSPHPRPYFLFVGRLERLKGLDDVIPLFDRYPDADLLIVGDGTHAATLRKLAAHNPRVRFIGRLAADELPAYYRNAIALLVPSIGFETFGITLIEAFSHGTPAIARRLGPFPEIVQQSGGGELFDTSDELLASMRGMQNVPLRRDAFGRVAYQSYLDRWSERAVVPQYLDLIEAAQERRRGSIDHSLTGGKP